MAANDEILLSSYLDGSEGRINMFFRPAGTEYTLRGVEWEQVQADDAYIVQWEGSPLYDSGYSASEFPTYEAAVEEFDYRTKGE